MTSLLKLRQGQCRALRAECVPVTLSRLGVPVPVPTYCGQPAEASSSWCPAHRLAYIAPPARPLSAPPDRQRRNGGPAEDTTPDLCQEMENAR